MSEQMTINDLISADKIILPQTAEEAEKTLKEKIQARNKAQALINDAKARYIKEKTRARSKKAAEEKDAILNSPRFDKLKEYDRREDIQECYGWDMIDEAERDKLEALWDEREAIRNKTVDGIYNDLVTDALFEAIKAIVDLWEDEIEKCEMTVKEYKEQRKQAEIEAKEWMDRQNKAYMKLTKGEANGRTINRADEP